MAVKFTMKSTRELLKARGLMAGDTAQKFVDGEVLRRCAPMVPFDSGALNRSGTTNTRLGSGEVRYATPTPGAGITGLRTSPARRCAGTTGLSG